MAGSSDRIMPFPDIREIEAQAADWVVRLDSDTSTAELRAAFAEWRRRSDQHGEAYDRLRGLWDTLDGVEQLEDHRADGAGTGRAGTRAEPSRWTRWWAVAASVALLGVTVAVLFQEWAP
jgi:ferric-dicitrate binding protein FerR (iron transport regulator)